MHRLRDFKNFGSAALDLFEPLTILLGRNGGGKTNLLEGIELLAALARGVPVSEVTDVGQGGTLELRGGLASCVRFGTKSFELGFDHAEIRISGKQQSISYAIEIAERNTIGVYLAAERLSVGGRTYFDAQSKDGEVLHVEYDNFARERNPRCQLSASSSVLSRYGDVVANSHADGARLQVAKGVVAKVSAYLRGSRFFDPIPKAMHNYERKSPHPNLLPNGSNLSAVLFALARGDDAGKRALRRITRTIQQVIDEPFQAIGFVETYLGDVIAGFVRPNGSRPIDVRLLSDGTLRTLAVLTALETVPRNVRIVIENFDASLHPSRAKLFARHLSQAARRRGLNVVLTTHNPAFMNALDDDQMRYVWICHRAYNASSVARLLDMNCSKTIGLDGGLGDHVASGALERWLAPGYGAERKEGMRRWLESLAYDKQLEAYAG